jgi:hypothetical protein
MSKTNKIVLIVSAAVILLFLVFFFILKGYMPKYRWDENYGYKNEQPYGLKLMYDILSGTRPAKDFTVINGPPENYLKKSDTASLYIFIGARFITDSTSSLAFMKFVKRGNNVFISGINSTHYLFDFLTRGQHPMLYPSVYSDSMVNVSLTNRARDSVYTFDHRYADKKIYHEWVGFEPVVLTDTLTSFGFERVSHINNGLVDCFRVKWGKGWFIFHFNPVLFTNYHLSKEQGLNYANALLSEYGKPKIYWDEFSKIQMRSGYDKQHESPLRFILSERSLKLAWYLICILILMFVVFNAKRKQAYIPLMPVNRNTTVEYITAIATLHYQNNSVEFLADEMMKQFKSFVKHKYGISPHLEKDEMVRQLAPLSGVPKETLDNLFKRYLDFKYLPEVRYLIEFYELTEYFYQKCI